MQSVADLLVFCVDQCIVDVALAVQEHQEIEGFLVSVLGNEPSWTLGHPEEK
jgi:hypothetical protein